MVVLKTQVYKK